MLPFSPEAALIKLTDAVFSYFIEKGLGRILQSKKKKDQFREAAHKAAAVFQGQYENLFVELLDEHYFTVTMGGELIKIIQPNTAPDIDRMVAQYIDAHPGAATPEKSAQVREGINFFLEALQNELVATSELSLGMQGKKISGVAGDTEQIRLDTKRILEGVNTLLERNEPTPRTKALFESILETDTLVIEAIHVQRNVKALPPERIGAIYRRMLDGGLPAPMASCSDVMEFMNHGQNIAREIELLGKHSLSVSVAPGFKKVTFSPDPDTYLSHDNPELLWDCNCLTNKNQKIPCKIHKNKKFDDIDSLFTKHLVEIDAHETSVWYKAKESIWPPSIDTYHLAEDLKADGVLTKHHVTVMDMGAGTGFLGLWIANNNPYVKDVYFTDWLLSPLLLSAINCHRILREGVRPHFLLGRFAEWMGCDEPPQLDLLVCNPPYIPTKNSTVDMQIQHTVIGTDLLEFLLAQGNQLAETTYVSYSMLADLEAAPHLEKLGDKAVELNCHTVPFRVSAALKKGNEAFIDYHKREGRLLYDEDGYHQLHHRLRTMRIDR